MSAPINETRGRGGLFPQPMMSVVTLLVWLLANNAVTPGVLTLGVLFAVGIPLVTASFWPEYPARIRYGALARFLAVVVYDIVVANVRVALLILGPTRRLRPTFFTIELELRGGFPVTLLASTISLTPGTVSSDLSEDGRTLLVHGLDVGDVDQAVAQIRRRYERPLMEIFG
jgi:multicomponent K+:H+ antiporter subunit E